MPVFTIRSELGVTPESFWQGMSMAAVNAELHPLVHMTTPAVWRECAVSQWSTGRVLFRSVILLFGLLPVDVHSLRLAHIDSTRGFVERSHSWANRLWQHERVTTRTPFGCTITDTVLVESRLPGMATLLLPIYQTVFRHRHRRLRAMHSAPRTAGAG